MRVSANSEPHAMNEMTMDGAMMWGMGLGSWLGLLILALAAAALIKYVFFR